ncbi:sodium/nucleoside cotransporter 1 isoform X2 [Callorhinchus milii]|nr:sodium/nucleoside cotransporter 1 isoform X2 [Callorhinchus milii]XP_042198975.1 sodium/nucleoside cotransporter 1 isoform X2 [Callorhinchus milii]XP_042198976.1 sodium/nucleoside cotransporter 1 isoform X2 [Callorhinchus milii]XP_042198977.1 sodium/nucleoside cotransporter 1 isoform X2 [Callorhinchus milii]XP_042198978.1 sodium/nucleoside cotransporter 1 isoform X2 [Callorhinchus milii]XP_042198979.1 sodium/nucleoside cotransporter 1 isoform X2 [Callorhinchus milii]|eukprot:gi/632939121/ref/XP_007907758.1/ PREDICTED: sodium/nucleoside cotransporter 1-like [Callorhinchus milii]
MEQEKGSHYKKPSNGVENAAFEISEDPAGHASKDPYSHDSPPLSSWKKKKPKFVRHMSQNIKGAKLFYESHSTVFKRVVLGILLAGFVAFLITACVMSFQRALALFVMTCLVLVIKIYELIKKLWGKRIVRLFQPVSKVFKNNSKWLQWIFALLALGGLVAWLAIDTAKRPEQLISFGGLCMFIIILFVFSSHPGQVSWRAVGWGLGLQFCLGLFIIRTEPGFAAFDWLGLQIQIFLDYTKAGSGFVFGEALIADVFAFQALPIVIFFSCVMSILYYLGLMQWLILKIAWLMQITMGTAPTESLSVAGNIFVGQTEAPLLIRPYLPEMTKSEIHAVMTGGYATIAGSVLGAYISFGISASGLIAASVMAAPCALALSKLSYPEVEESKFMTEEGVKIDCGDAQNILEAASNGASDSICLVANIAANLIAFLAILEFLNAGLSWIGGMVDYPELTFELICSYIFMPIAFMMGAEWKDASVMAELIGVKLFLNEFVAFKRLSLYQENRLNGLEEYLNGKKQWITPRTETIATYALCGFANFSSIGIMLGGLSSMAPQRKGDMAQLVIRALFTGTCTSLLNACVAGILYVPRGSVDCVSFLNGSLFNTASSELFGCCQDLFSSAVSTGNGTWSFDGQWNTVAESPKFMTNCCGLYNNTVCFQ